jgi:hypothetical protein
MNNFKVFTQPFNWFMAFLLVAIVSGCGGSGNGDGSVIANINAPTVTSIAPADLASSIAINTNITATFSKAMNASTINSTTFTLKQGTTPVAGTVTYVGNTAIFNPGINLNGGSVYTATITTGAKDLAGNALAAPKTWTFTTSSTIDTTPPTVSSVFPANMATGILLNANIVANFSETMDPSTINFSTFSVKKQGTTTDILGAITSTSATFNPTYNLDPNSVYTATLSTGVKDLAGNALAAPYTWSFTTGTLVGAGPAPVILGGAGNYVILAETQITTTGTTAVTGDIGVSPAAASFIQGFGLILDATGCFSTSSLVTGKIYAADYNTGGCTTPSILTTSVNDMLTAYTDAAGRAPDYTELGAGNISGKTLVPGTYKWGTGVLINTDVTLNGGPNDVWIFEIAQDLTVASGAKVILAGGALPKNIFWQVAGGTGVAIGTTAHMEGVILAAKAITLNTGATLNGRLLAQTAVTLKANTLTKPAP